MGSQLAGQIASLKERLGYGGLLSQTEGQANSSWGLGTSPYAVAPTQAPSGANQENRQGDKSLKDTAPTQFEQLYSAENYAHSTYDTQVKGHLDISGVPQKVEEIRSAPQSQQALVEYSNVIGGLADSEEAAVEHEEVPREYRELVKEYFDQLQKDAKAGKAAKSGSGNTSKPAGKTTKGKSGK